MAQYYELSGLRIQQIPDHLGGTCCVPNGGTVSLTLPTGTRSVYFRAEGGAAYYDVNAAAAGTVTPGYVPSNNADMVFTCDNLASVSVFAAAGVQVHIQYYSG